MAKSPKTLTAEEVADLLTELLSPRHTTKGFNAQARNLVIVLLMLDAGLRVAEVSGLFITDIFIHGDAAKSLIVRAEIAKNHNERTIPTSSRLRKACL